jgi:hypothetical protein
MRDDRLLPLLGYDVQLAAALDSRHYAQLRSVVTGWLCALFLVSWPIGYVFWLTEHSTLLATLGPVGAYLLCLNLLRVAVAGGGAGASFSLRQVTEWRPGWVPSIFLCVLAFIVAQPAHLLFTHHAHAAQVAERRAELIALHATLSEVPGVATSDAFTASLATCEFAVYRLQLLWAAPTSAARFTALYGLLVLVPVFWTRYIALGALRAYERLRYSQVVSHKLQASTATEVQVKHELSRWITAERVTPAEAPTVRGHRGPDPNYVTSALSAPRQARRSQLILKWRAWE